ncbi:unnamed protein product [Closterium sp. NIES-53]
MMARSTVRMPRTAPPPSSPSIASSSPSPKSPPCDFSRLEEFQFHLADFGRWEHQETPAIVAEMNVGEFVKRNLEVVESSQKYGGVVERDEEQMGKRRVRNGKERRKTNSSDVTRGAVTGGTLAFVTLLLMSVTSALAQASPAPAPPSPVTPLKSLSSAAAPPFRVSSQAPPPPTPGSSSSSSAAAAEAAAEAAVADSSSAAHISSSAPLGAGSGPADAAAGDAVRSDVMASGASLPAGEDLVGWEVRVEFTRNELITLLGNAQVEFELPYPGSALLFSSIDDQSDRLITAIHAGGDVRQYVVFAEVFGTEFGAATASKALPRTLYLTTPGFHCASNRPQFPSPNRIQVCCRETSYPPPPPPRPPPRLPPIVPALTVQIDITAASDMDHQMLVTISNLQADRRVGPPRNDPWALSWRWTQNEVTKPGNCQLHSASSVVYGAAIATAHSCSYNSIFPHLRDSFPTPLCCLQLVWEAYGAHATQQGNCQQQSASSAVYGAAIATTHSCSCLPLSSHTLFPSDCMGGIRSTGHPTRQLPAAVRLLCCLRSSHRHGLLVLLSTLLFPCSPSLPISLCCSQIVWEASGAQATQQGNCQQQSASTAVYGEAIARPHLLLSTKLPTLPAPTRPPVLPYTRIPPHPSDGSQIVWEAYGAQATQQGNCQQQSASSAVYRAAIATAHSCSPRPVFVDLPGGAYGSESGRDLGASLGVRLSCCKNGSIGLRSFPYGDPALAQYQPPRIVFSTAVHIDPSQLSPLPPPPAHSLSPLPLPLPLLTLPIPPGKPLPQPISGRHVALPPAASVLNLGGIDPSSFSLLFPRSPPPSSHFHQVNPSRNLSAVATWRYACYRDPSSPPPRPACCVSFSAAFNNTGSPQGAWGSIFGRSSSTGSGSGQFYVSPCKTCACGCPGEPDSSSSSSSSASSASLSSVSSPTSPFSPPSLSSILLGVPSAGNGTATNRSSYRHVGLRDWPMCSAPVFPPTSLMPFLLSSFSPPYLIMPSLPSLLPYFPPPLLPSSPPSLPLSLLKPSLLMRFSYNLRYDWWEGRCGPFQEASQLVRPGPRFYFCPVPRQLPDPPALARGGSI